MTGDDAAIHDTKKKNEIKPHVNFPNCIFKAVLKEIVGIVRALA